MKLIQTDFCFFDCLYSIDVLIYILYFPCTLSFGNGKKSEFQKFSNHFFSTQPSSMKVCTLNIIPILLAVRNAYSHSLLESTSFQFHSREVLLDDSTTTITTTTINDNQEGRDENSLKFMIQNELDSLRYHTTILSDNLAKQNKIKLQLPSEYLIALKEAFQTSFQNVTFMATELRLLLSESLGRPEESDIITSELNFSSDLFHNVEEKFNYLKEVRLND